MKLELDVRGAEVAGSVPSLSKLFDGTGGVIGRGAGCDWTIPDSTRLLSSHHGLIAYREGRYFLTDISSNGIERVGSGERLRKGLAHLINDGDEFRLGSLVIRARLIERTPPESRRPYLSAESIPDDAFLALDPIQTFDREQRRQSASQELDALREAATDPGHCMSYSAVDREHLGVPCRAEPVSEVFSTPSIVSPPTDEVFWDQFAAALGIRPLAIESPGREALAIKVARLLRLAIEGLQQSLRTREELKAELDLPVLDTPLKNRNPLKEGIDTDAALAALLGADIVGQLSAEQAVTQVHQDLQTHQVALLAACRSALRTTRAAFAPGHLLTCFHYEERRPRFSTDGGYWRAYQRHYQRVTAGGQSGNHWPDGDFAKAYEEQVRLISTLHLDYPG